MWEVETTTVFDTWFAELPESGREEILAKVELLKEFGPQLGRPHADTLNGSKHANMKELRADADGLVLRIAFAFDPLRCAVLLIGDNKTGVNQKRFYKQLIKRADVLYQQHTDRINANRKEKE